MPPRARRPTGPVLAAAAALLCACAADPVAGRYTCDPDQPGACPGGWYCRPTSQQDLTYRCFPSPAPPLCGNGVREGGEECDGADLAGETCATQGLAGGPLRCDADCRLSTRSCLGQLCGDGVVQGHETCDGSNLGSTTCAAAGFGPGELGCFYNCSLDYRDCAPLPTCGNGTRDASEHCDGGLGEASCTTLGFPGGLLRCAPNCSLDTSGCVLSVCGNDQAESDHLAWEECDGGDLRSETCATLGFPGGDLACGAGCTFDTTGCTRLRSCGNGVREGLELCDGDDFDGLGCRSLGFSGGDLACTDACGYDTSGCETTGAICGNGLLEAGEECDGVQWAFSDCADLGYEPGPLGCITCTCTLDTNTCQCPPGSERVAGGCQPEVPTACGNGAIDLGEDCDGGDLNGMTCSALGHPGGVLGCSAVCAFDVSGCDLKWRAIAAGEGFTCVVKTDGTASCAGRNDSGQLGLGSFDAVTGFQPILSMPSFGDTVVASGHACATLMDDTVACWGQNPHGQLGDGPVTHQDCGGTDCSADPVIVAGLPLGAPVLAVGGDHSCALSGTGVAYCWGAGESGQLGAGLVDNQASATVVDATVLFTALGAGEAHTCGVDTFGALWCWGANLDGQLGIGGTFGTSEPTLVTALADVTAVTAGAAHTCSLRDTGAVHCWGRNDVGQLGIVDTTSRSTPVEVTGLPPIAAIAAGAAHTCAVTLDHHVYCWGLNDHGQLGDASTENRSAPVLVAEPSAGSFFVTAGPRHTCALQIGAGLVCWGDNQNGQFGTATPASSSVPVQLPSF